PPACLAFSNTRLRRLAAVRKNAPNRRLQARLTRRQQNTTGRRLLSASRHYKIQGVTMKTTVKRPQYLPSQTSALAVGLMPTAGVQAFPDTPITLLIPYPPGGSADMLARPIAAQMQKTSNQPVVLEYRPGAGGTIATAQLARSKPDGYTVLMVLAAHAINPSMYKSLPYDTEKDFAPVSVLATLPMLVTAARQTPANTTQELIDYAKANPDKLTFASAGNGNTSHLAAELFKSATGAKMIHVPYKGSGPAVVAMLSG